MKRGTKVRHRQKFFTLVNGFMSFCEAFFQNMQTKLLLCNTISYITSSCNVHNELWMHALLFEARQDVWAGMGHLLENSGAAFPFLQETD